jgi:hypothetical protein
MASLHRKADAETVRSVLMLLEEAARLARALLRAWEAGDAVDLGAAPVAAGDAESGVELAPRSCQRK